MKRMGIVVLAVALAGVVKAASINWAISGLDTAGEGGAMSGTDLAGAIVYGFVGDASAVTAASSAIQSGTFGTWLAGYDAANVLGNNLTGATGATSKLNQGSFVAGSDQSVFLVAFDAATFTDANNFLVTSTLVQSMPSVGARMYNFGAPGGAYVPSQWTAVPEPTSMALLALGVAALGLRRKFRA